MPWLPIYADENDMEMLLAEFNNDPEIAFIVYDGHGENKSKWKAIKEINNLYISRYCLWHVPSGPLPLLIEKTDKIDIIKDPWLGWEERISGADTSLPYFGVGHVGIIWLNNRINLKENIIGMSSFEWIGNRYSAIGRKAPEETEKWWKLLRKKITKISEKIGRDDTSKPEIFCLKGAKKKINNGYKRKDNPL